jgi:signal transduction histidine kinase
MNATDDQGMACACDLQGRVAEVIRDTLGVMARFPAGTPVMDLADPSNREKAVRLLEAVQSTSAAFDWQINVLLDGVLTPLHWGGGISGERIVVVVARTRNGLTRLSEELMRINNEQTNAVRALAKESARLVHAQEAQDARFLDQLSRLNNELATLQRELAKQNVELQRLNDLKNQFLGIAAHDLRSPLGIILTYSDFLEAELAASVSGEQRQLIQVIRATSESLLRLVEDLLDVSQIEAGKLELRRQPVDLSALIAQNTALHRVLAAKKRIELTFTTDQAVPLTLVADGPKLEQVLNNLLGNALKFSFPGGHVIVSLARDGARAVVSVRDDGPGIPADEVDRLFRFFQKTTVRSTGGERGTGLGLGIARKIVEGHGGTIGVETAVGRGSTFWFALPLEPIPPAPL